MKTSNNPSQVARRLPVSLLVALAFQAEAQTVAIPDPVLQDAIRQALEKPTGDITVQDMESLRELRASFGASGVGPADPILSLQGLEAANNLTSLNLAGWGMAGARGIVLTDFSPLAGLTNLTTLDLWHNFLTSLTLPAGLNNLKELNLGLNRLTDFSFLESLANLTTLDLSVNQLTNVTLPVGLSSLTTLYLSDNQLTNLTLPAALSNLTTLDLERNQLQILTLPAELSKLTALDLSENQLTRLTLPAGLSSLTSLNLDGNPVTNLSIVAGIPNLSPSLVDLKSSGVHVMLLPVLRSARQLANGDFAFELFADAGTFTVLRSTDLQTWIGAGTITVSTPNFPGTTFTDTSAHAQDKAFYRVK